jgi:hypothetical protein
VHLEGGASFAQTSCSGNNTTVIKNVIKRQWIKVWGIFTANDTTKLMFYPKPYTAEFSSGYQMFRNIQIVEVTNFRGFSGGMGRRTVIDNNGSLGATASMNLLIIYGTSEGGRAAFNFNIDIDLTIPIKDDFLTGGNFTLITRVRPQPEDLENYRGVGGWHIGSYKGLVFMQYENGVFAIGGGNGSSWLPGFQIPAWSGTYKTVAVVMDSAKNMTVYIDEVSQGTKNLNIAPTNENWHIGRCYNDTDRHFRGYIRNFNLYGKALSLEDIKFLSDTTTNNTGFSDNTVFAPSVFVPCSTNTVYAPLDTFGIGENKNYIAATDFSDLGRSVRFVRDSANGSNVNPYNHLVEIQAIDVNGVNRARDRSGGVITNNDIATANYLDVPSSYTLDLGAVYTIASITVWHYFGDGRTYKNTKRDACRPEHNKDIRRKNGSDNNFGNSKFNIRLAVIFPATVL